MTRCTEESDDEKALREVVEALDEAAGGGTGPGLDGEACRFLADKLRAVRAHDGVTICDNPIVLGDE